MRRLLSNHKFIINRMSLMNPVFSHCDTRVFEGASDVYLRIAYVGRNSERGSASIMYCHIGQAIYSGKMAFCGFCSKKPYREFELDGVATRIRTLVESIKHSYTTLQTFIISKSTLMKQSEVFYNTAEVFDKDDLNKHLRKHLKSCIDDTLRDITSM